MMSLPELIKSFGSLNQHFDNLHFATIMARGSERHQARFNIFGLYSVEIAKSKANAYLKLNDHIKADLANINRATAYDRNGALAMTSRLEHVGAMDGRDHMAKTGQYMNRIITSVKYNPRAYDLYNCEGENPLIGISRRISDIRAEYAKIQPRIDYIKPAPDGDNELRQDAKVARKYLRTLPAYFTCMIIDMRSPSRKTGILSLKLDWEKAN